MPSSSLIKEIRKASAGEGSVVHGPYGPRRITYADWAASGRSISFIEDFITKEVLPMYANTHTEASGTARQTTRFREDARAIIAREVNAVAGEASVIFTGSGSTAAINKLVAMLGLHVPKQLDERYNFVAQIPPDERPVVFIGPFEHHSNELPWRESIAEVIVIPEGENDSIDLHFLQRALKKYRHRPLRIGSFSAASNVTGVVSDTKTITSLLHHYGALACFDYAAGGPHMKIDFGNKDAIFLSPHKFPGGVGTPGILVVRNSIVTNRVPAVPGGGTVDFVNFKTQMYTKDLCHREEGGTPAIVESIRAGLTFQLKAAVGSDKVARLEQAFLQKCLKAWSSDPNIYVLGRPNAKRVSIVSFLIRRPDNKYLHHNFVVALLNDLFGIQGRGGCSCAGPYGHRLFQLDEVRSGKIMDIVADDLQGIKPGWARVTFKYFISEATASYIINAIQLIGKLGWALMPLYTFNPKTGLWAHRNGPSETPLGLTELSYKTGSLQWRSRTKTVRESAISDYLQEATAILTTAARNANPAHFSEENTRVSPLFDEVRWFDLPAVCLAKSGPSRSAKPSMRMAEPKITRPLPQAPPAPASKFGKDGKGSPDRHSYSQLSPAFEHKVLKSDKRRVARPSLALTIRRIFKPSADREPSSPEFDISHVLPFADSPTSTPGTLRPQELYLSTSERRL